MVCGPVSVPQSPLSAMGVVSLTQGVLGGWKVGLIIPLAFGTRQRPPAAAQQPAKGTRGRWEGCCCDAEPGWELPGRRQQGARVPPASCGEPGWRPCSFTRAGGGVPGSRGGAP